ncbi:MAG: TrkH family potassium uptake protein [Prevotellaceae bacterium]|jgi:trk system potassium uptake protein TrkH|nr:TrkH family potassium uptake protein [Prevotellaceae bacterium]
MRTHVIARYTGLALMLNALFMLLSVGVSLLHRDAALVPLLVSAAVTGVVGFSAFVLSRQEVEINMREGYLIVVLGWVMSCTFGMLPYLLYGGEFSLANAWFESVSGYTTTGATILSNVEALPKGLLFWRSSTTWVGGVGVVVFTLLVLPSMGSAKMRLSRMQVGALKHEEAKYSMQQIVRIILSVYVGITVTLTLLLWIAGMSFFDAINHAFSTAATGGFSVKNASIMAYESPLIEGILIAFMIISSLNFGLLYVAFAKKFTTLLNSSVVRYFVASLAVGALLITINLVQMGVYDSWLRALRDAAFQVVAMASTTGFAASSNAAWPAFSVLISFFFMLQCGCIGSTSGGIKADRVLIFYKAFVANVRKTLHPNAVIPVRLRGVALDEELVSATTLFIALYMATFFATALLLLFTGLDLLTGLSAAAAALGNVGPGFGEIYSLGNHSAFSGAAKTICSIAMLLGRLEIYGLLIIFYYRYWR